MLTEKKTFLKGAAMVLLLMVLPISGVCAQESFVNGNFDENGELTWSYDYVDYTLTISGSGSMESVPEKWNDFKEEATIVEIADEVLNICDDAFNGFTSLKDLTIGSSVTSIGASAFSGCTALESIEIPTSVTEIGESAFARSGLTSIALGIDEGDEKITIGDGAFENCKNLSTLTLGENVKSIGAYAFYGCGITELKVPSTVETVGEYAFSDCDSLLSATIPNNSENNEIDSNIFIGCEKLEKLTITGTGTITEYNPSYYLKDILTTLIIGNGIDSIGESAFFGCELLTSVTIPTGVKIIGESAFSGCVGLTAIDIPTSVTSIGDNAFQESGLTSIYLEGNDDEQMTIGDCAFVDCKDLCEVTFGNNVKSIGESAFFGCAKLDNIDISTSVTYIGYFAFSGSGITSLYLEGNDDEKMTIGVGAFEECKDLSEVTIGENVDSIGEIAFSGCGITQLVIPSTVKTVGGEAFGDCKSLESAIIPNNSKNNEIDSNIFSGCEKLEKLTITGTGTITDFNPADNLSDILTTLIIGEGIDSIGEYAFYEFSKLKTIVISTSVTYIGDYAFSGSGLTSIELDGSSEGKMTIGDSAFENCKNLSELTLGEYVDSIGEGAFLGCGITELVIPLTVEFVGEDAFGDCDELLSATIPNYSDENAPTVFVGCENLATLTITGTDTISDLNPVNGYLSNVLTTLTIGNGITAIGKNAFYSCEALTTVAIPTSVTSIGENAFEGCTALESIAIPTSVTEIGASAFEGSGLMSIALGTEGDEMITIGDGAFAYCEKLSELTLGEYVDSIGAGAFFGCGITELVIPSTVEFVGGNAFGDCLELSSATIPNISGISESVFVGCENLATLTITGTGTITDLNPANYSLRDVVTTLIIDSGITGIDEDAFNGCESLTSVTIPGSVTNIGVNAFAGCGLTAIDLDGSSEGKMTVGAGAFADCESLTEATIGEDVESLGANVFSGCDLFETLSVNMKDISNSAFAYCEFLSNVTIGENVESIGDSAFFQCELLESLTIPTSVKSIGASAFELSGLNSIDLDGSSEGKMTIGNSAFANCEYLSDVTIGENVESIGSGAFYGCTALQSVDIPTSVITIGESAFSCSGLLAIEIQGNQDSGTSIGDGVFEGCTELESVITENVGTISKRSFAGCSALKTLFIGENVETIDDFAFQDCSSLESVSIPLNVTFIGQGAFSGCSNLTGLTISDGVNSIGADAFLYCNLESVKIPASVTSIGSAAFGGNPVVTITVDEDNTIYDSRDDCNAIIETKTGVLVAGCGNTFIPDSVKVIGEDAFYACDNLSSITIPNCVTSIGDRAFYGCQNLDDIIIPALVTDIGKSAFYECCFSSINIPARVTSIGDSVFLNCKYLVDIYCYANPKKLTWDDEYEDITPTCHVFDEKEWSEFKKLNFNFVNDLGYLAHAAHWHADEEHNGESAERAYIIDTTEGLDLLATEVNLGYNYFETFFELGADIEYDYSMLGSRESNYTAIGYYDDKLYDEPDDEYPFCGTFDGKGYTVSGIRIYKEGELYDSNFQGVFGIIGYDGLVKNLNLEDSYITSGGFSGGIAGENDGSIENCTVLSSVNVSINGTVDVKNFGGIAGYNTGNINNCLSYAQLSVVEEGYCSALGGIAGMNDVTGNVSNCISSVTVDYSGDSNFLGGVVGYNYFGTVTGNLAIDAVIGYTHNSGAIVGINDKGTLVNNYYSNCDFSDDYYEVSGSNVGDITENDGAVKAEILSDAETVPTLDDDVKVVFRREFTAGKASTICLPFEYTPGTEGAYYIFSGIERDGGKYVATMTQETSDKLAANTPYLFMPAATGPVLYNGMAAYDVSEDLATIDGDWTFYGTYTPLSYGTEPMTGYIYGFASKSMTFDDVLVEAGEFVRAAEGASIPPMRCYLTYKNGEQFAQMRAGTRGTSGAAEEIPSRITVRLVNASGALTAVGSLDLETGEFAADTWFDMNGHLLEGEPTDGGLYIHNGSKVMINK